MLHVALLEPEIPPNTGNIIRLCANTGASLHLVGPLGFRMDDADLRRAGLDYHEHACVQRHANLDALRSALPDSRMLAFSTRGQRLYTAARYRADDVLLFGPESRGLPGSLLASLAGDHVLRLPMRPGQRSLNLSNAVAVACFEAWRQLGFRGGA